MHCDTPFKNWVSFAVFAALTACSGDDEAPNASDGGGDARVQDGGARDATLVDGRVVDGSAELSCEDMHYFASGELCESCSFGCECEDDFPISLAACTEDGCVIDGDCKAVCQVGLRRALECADVYTAPLANGATCTDASLCKSGSCIEGQCATWTPAWYKTFSVSTNNASPQYFEVDGNGLRAVMFSNDGADYGQGVMEGLVALALDEDGETRSVWPVPHPDLSLTLAPVGEDSVVLGYAREALELGDTTLTPTGEGDYYVARFSATGEVKWAHHFTDSRRHGSMVLDGTRVLVTFAAEDVQEEVILTSLDVETGTEQWRRVVVPEVDLETSFGSSGYQPRLFVAAEQVVSVVHTTYGKGIAGVEPPEFGSFWLFADTAGSAIQVGTFADLSFNMPLGQDGAGNVYFNFNRKDGEPLPGPQFATSGGVFRARWNGETFESPQMAGNGTPLLSGSSSYLAAYGSFEDVLVWGGARHRLGLTRHTVLFRVNAEGVIDRRLIFRATGSKPPSIRAIEVDEAGTVYFGVRAKNAFFLDDVEYPGHAGNGEIAYIFAMEN